MSLDLEYFKAGNYDWGGNRFKITQHFYEKFFKDFKKGTSFETEGQSKKFKENIYNLLKLSENKPLKKHQKIGHILSNNKRSMVKPMPFLEKRLFIAITIIQQITIIIVFVIKQKLNFLKDLLIKRKR